jgi:hypothetical protein
VSYIPIAFKEEKVAESYSEAIASGEKPERLSLIIA